MMISPDSFIRGYEKESYKILLTVRDSLIQEIRHFEEKKEYSIFELKDPSPDVVYQCNLDYLAKLCELIKDKYNQEYVR